MSSYSNTFLLAIERTSSQGYETEPYELPSGPGRISEEHGKQLADIASQVLGSKGQLEAIDIACRCAEVSLAMKGHVERVVGHTATLTIGAVTLNGTSIIQAHGLDIPQMARTGSYHVWLTLPWLEIVDFTLRVSLAVLNGRPLTEAGPLAGYPDFMKPAEWHPIYVGTAATTALLDRGRS
ncbi:hypothetical protein [Hydrogenophaga sp.]|uniref:hypothetical protein n=1 Tax=Hydrogenophaga sp. TaxID=1904254 RepID=UPI0025C33D70|nr:hypothetical protein [Hydrogenophaga sp.]MBT9463623.1 hypothetical protein [Hydrogenophaga sp.]